MEYLILYALCISLILYYLFGCYFIGKHVDDVNKSGYKKGFILIVWIYYMMYLMGIDDKRGLKK
jgi:hypothetical protein